MRTNAAVVDFTYNSYLLADDDDACRLLSIMMNAKAVDVSYDNIVSFTADSKKQLCTIKVLPASSIPETVQESEAIKRMQEQVQEHTKQWSTEYQKRKELDKQVKELQDKLNEALEQIVQNSVSPLAAEIDAADADDLEF